MEPVIAAHRGLDEYAPENTAPAIIAALELGMAVEFDVRRTADGELIIMHDASLDRTTDGTGPVSSATLAQMRSLDAGGWFEARFGGVRVLTLADLFELAARHGRAEITLVLEAKVDDDAIAADICRLLNEHGLMARTVGIGTMMRSEEIRKRYRGADPAFPAAVLADSPDDLEGALADACSAWVYTRFAPSRQQVSRSHDAGKRVIASGSAVMNKIGRACEAMANGADAAISNHPVALAARWRNRSRP